MRRREKAKREEKRIRSSESLCEVQRGKRGNRGWNGKQVPDPRFSPLASQVRSEKSCKVRETSVQPET